MNALWSAVKSHAIFGCRPDPQIDRLDEIGFEWETEKSLKAEQLRAEREAFETNRREKEAIRIRELQIQQLADATKSSLARAVLPLKRRRPTAVSARSPSSKKRSPPSKRSGRRGSSGSSSDTEVEGAGAESEGEDDDEADQDDPDESSAGQEEEDVSVATAEVVARRCSRVDYESDGDDDKVVVASIVWDEPPPPVHDQG
jgi:hypothetical protein